MALGTLSSVAIRGVVGAVPGEPRSVAELGAQFSPADVEQISKTAGLKSSHRVRPGETAGDLCLYAARQLLDDLGWSPESVDGIIMVTQHPDHFAPANACVIHGKLGLPVGAIAYDIAMGCSGYVYGLLAAGQHVSSGMCKRFLLLAGDTSSLLASPGDRGVAMLFGDAGTATALEYDESAPVMSFALHTDGTGVDSLVVPAGGFRERASEAARARVPAADGAVRAATDLYMDGLAVFNFTIKRVPPLIREILDFHGWVPDQVDALVMHQANAFILKTIAKRVGISESRVPVNIDKFGNTSMATIPMVIADSLSDRVRGPEPIAAILAGFGVGLSWAAAGVSLNMPVARIVQIP